MGYEMANRRYAKTRAVTVAAAGTVTTATGAVTGTTVELGDQAQARLTLAVTAVSGTTPSVTLTLETSPDSTTWTAVASFAAATAVSTQYRVFTGIDRFVRLNATAVSGTTPSVTYSVTGETV